MALVKMDWNPPAKTLRLFGVIGVVAFPLLALAAHRQFGLFAGLPAAAVQGTMYTLLGLGGYCLIGAAAAPTILKPLFIGMSIVGIPIGLVVSYLLLGIVYFLVITPIALIFKIIGRDSMTRKFEPAAQTYWVPRKRNNDIKRYFRQF